MSFRGRKGSEKGFLEGVLRSGFREGTLEGGNTPF